MQEKKDAESGNLWHLLTSYHASLFGQPAPGICQTSSMSVSRNSHAVILPSALEMVPGRADQAELPSLGVDDTLQLKLDIN